jgi:catechol 2,3-dioxygenase-like lactoylglutathione lyase family enzyme
MADMGARGPIFSKGRHLLASIEFGRHCKDMFDHIGFLVRDTATSVPFFTACLAPLGIERVQDLPQFDAALFKDPAQRGFLFVAGDKKGVPTFWRTGNVPGAAPIHLAFAAPTRAAVEAFYVAALAHGGRDNGPPGFRDQGHRRDANYVAFVLDPDSNNIEASWANPLVAG